MSAQKTAFLFVPGAWCPGFYFHKVTEKLQVQGYEAQYVDLPSVGKKDVAPDLEDDVAIVRSAAIALLDAGNNLIIGGNSYGGFVTLESCKSLVESARPNSAGHLVHILIIDSFLAEVGDTMKDLAEGAPVPDNIDDPWIEPVPGVLGYQFFCGSLPAEEGMKYGNMIEAQSVKPMFDPLTFAAYEEVPTTMVIGGRDIALKPERQHESFDKAVKRGVKGLRKVVIEEGDHCPMLNAPDAVVKACLDVLTQK
jgi:pimeloyl-ACP methyl ester carboxylesterase